jgi:hypothetical protein
MAMRGPGLEEKDLLAGIDPADEDAAEVAALLQANFARQ